MKWIPVIGIFLAKWPIRGKVWNRWFWYQISMICLGFGIILVELFRTFFGA